MYYTKSGIMRSHAIIWKGKIKPTLLYYYDSFFCKPAAPTNEKPTTTQNNILPSRVIKRYLNYFSQEIQETYIMYNVYDNMAITPEIAGVEKNITKEKIIIV